jgi:hypothetical protein
MELNTVSASDISLFSTCPLWFLLYKNKVKGIEVDNEASQYGIDIHNLIREYFNYVKSHKDYLSPDFIETTFYEMFDKAYVNDSPKFKNKSSNIKENFVRFERERLERDGIENYLPTSIEQKLCYENLVGVIDYYNENTGTIIDWKTGNMTILEPYHYVQGKLYERLLTRLGKPVKQVLFVALSSGMSFEMPYVTDSWLDEKINYLLDSVKLNRFRPNPSGLCAYCPYILECQTRRMCLWL